ncbi:MAG: hypothetical protein WBC70_05825 [Candidatus Aminicenantales bacterium]
MPDNAARNADNGAVVRHIPQHNGIRPEIHVVADGEVAKHFFSRVDNNIVAYRRVAFAGFFGRAAKRDALKEHVVVPGDGSFANDDAQAVVNEEPAANLRAGVNFDARHQTSGLGNHAREIVDPNYTYRSAKEIGKRASTYFY